MHFHEPVSFLRVRIWLSSPLLLLVLWLSKRCQFSMWFSSLSLLWMASLSTSWVPFGAATSGYSSIPDMMPLELWYKNVVKCIALCKGVESSNIPSFFCGKKLIIIWLDHPLHNAVIIWRNPPYPRLRNMCTTPNRVICPKKFKCFCEGSRQKNRYFTVRLAFLCSWDVATTN